MTREDYSNYYIQGSDHYLIPKDIFDELFNEMDNWKKEVQLLKDQLNYLRSGEYINQLKFERDMLQYIVDNGEVQEEDKKIIDMTHSNTELLEENQELKKKLGEQQYYKFYKYDNNPDGSDYCYCGRPCDDNMSLRCFLENGEILGFMSETLVSAYDNIKEITMSDFMFEFVKPLIKENYIMRTQQQEFIEWLEDYIDALKQQKETIEGLDIGEEHILMTLEEVLEKYKEIIGVKDE